MKRAKYISNGTITYKITGDPGPQGPEGPKGDTGKSAYQIAVDNGYNGTEEEWLETLKVDLDDVYVGGKSYESPNIFDLSAVEWGNQLNPGGSTTGNEKGMIYTLPFEVPVNTEVKITANQSFNWSGMVLNIYSKQDGTYIDYKQFVQDGDCYTATINERKVGTTSLIVKIGMLRSNSFDGTQLMLVVGDKSNMPTEYLPYGIITEGGHFTDYTDEHIREIASEFATEKGSWYKGKKLCTFGDSITAMGYWQPFVKNYFGFSTVTNCGIGGTTVHNNGANDSSGNATWMCSDYRINQIPSDSDVILIMGGMNDWYTELEIGTIALGSTQTADDKTFVGAYQIMLSKIAKKFPNSMIVCLTVTNSRVWQYGTNPDNPPVNWGKTLRDFADATIKVANTYSVKCIDVNAECGISFTNQSDYCEDGTHPNNTTGAKAIANSVINGLKRFEPIAFD